MEFSGVCPSCNHNIASDDAFCPECGANTKIKVCASCNAENSPDAEFCSECGAAFMSVSVPISQPVISQAQQRGSGGAWMLGLSVAVALIVCFCVALGHHSPSASASGVPQPPPVPAVQSAPVPTEPAPVPGTPGDPPTYSPQPSSASAQYQDSQQQSEPQQSYAQPAPIMQAPAPQPMQQRYAPPQHVDSPPSNIDYRRDIDMANQRLASDKDQYDGDAEQVKVKQQVLNSSQESLRSANEAQYPNPAYIRMAQDRVDAANGNLQEANNKVSDDIGKINADQQALTKAEGNQ